MSQTIDLTLDGLSCGHCVKRVKESLEQRPDVEQADVSITEAHVTGTASAEQLIETIKQAGYDASVSHPKAKPLAESSIPSEALTAVSEALPAATADDDDSQQLLLSGMSCASCVTRVQNALQSVPGVTQARVNLAERTALVMGSASAQDLVQAVEKAGYGAEAIEDDAKRRERQQETAVATMKRFRWQAIVALAVGIPVMVWGMIGDNMMVTADNRSLWLVIGLITLAVMVFAGGHFYRSAWKSLLNGAATMDTLVALGTGVAWLYSMSVNLWPQWFPMEARHLYYEASAMIIGLINLGHMLEARARQRSSKALEKLLDLTPPTARLVTDEGEKSVPLAEVQPGMLLRLTTGDRVPVDGEITQGEAWLDEAMLTGEPIPQQKGEGESVHAGTVVQDGSVLFESATDQPMENHLSRPEIKQAISDGVGKDIRDSQTMGYETYYYAVLLPTGEILRVAQDAETIWSIYDSSIPAIVLSCVALMMAAAILAGLLTKALVQPVLDMTEDLDHIQENVPYKELIPFAESIHSDRILRENNEKMRQEFTANVSHELKTPLTSISGYAELIETGIAKPEDVQGFAQKIHVEATRMLQLVNDILQLSKLDSASETGNTPAMEVVDLLDVAKECVERQKLNARRAYISLSYLGESAPVRGSRDLLDELCQNLCDNAIRYNRPGGKVQITTACSRDGHCTLTVADNGIGIPKEAQSSVFERFYRVDKSRSKATGGTGLGLAIVKHIARIHGARIKLESQVDEGTTITVTFPTAD